SVDTKKKELVGDFSNKGQEWHPKGEPPKVRVHDFIDKVDHEMLVKCIAHTTTNTGLRVKARLDRRRYPAKVKVPDERMKSLRVRRARFHGDWNYMLKPAQ